MLLVWGPHSNHQPQINGSLTIYTYKKLATRTLERLVAMTQCGQPTGLIRSRTSKPTARSSSTQPAPPLIGPPTLRAGPADPQAAPPPLQAWTDQPPLGWPAGTHPCTNSCTRALVTTYHNYQQYWSHVKLKYLLLPLSPHFPL